MLSGTNVVMCFSPMTVLLLICFKVCMSKISRKTDEFSLNEYSSLCGPLFIRTQRTTHFRTLPRTDTHTQRNVRSQHINDMAKHRLIDKYKNMRVSSQQQLITHSASTDVGKCLHSMPTCNSLMQGLYRNLTVVFQTFPGQNYFFFSRLFKAFCEQDITKSAFKC